jgi:hypothetical protein
LAIFSARAACWVISSILAVISLAAATMVLAAVLCC